jgi:L-alanine-DL-glutamate epimerase-like enolase superfamily enzyme
MDIIDFSYFYFKPKLSLKSPLPSFLKKGSIFIRLTDQHGYTGWGEPNPYSASKDELLKILKNFELNLLSKKKIISPTLQCNNKGYNASLAAVNQALIDILSKRKKVPICKILNKDLNLSSINLYASGGMIFDYQDDKIYYNEAIKSFKDGYIGYKFRPPYPRSFSNHLNRLKKPPSFDIDRFLKISKKLRSILPKKFKLMVDFGFRIKNYKEFLKIYQILDDLNFYFIEEPINTSLIKKEFKIKNLKLSGGESFFLKNQFKNKNFNKFYKIIQPDMNLIDFNILKNIMKKESKKMILHNWFNVISNNFSLNCALAFKCKMIERNIYMVDIDKQILNKSSKLNIKNGNFLILKKNNNLCVNLNNLKKLDI